MSRSKRRLLVLALVLAVSAPWASSSSAQRFVRPQRDEIGRAAERYRAGLLPDVIYRAPEGGIVLGKRCGTPPWAAGPGLPDPPARLAARAKGKTRVRVWFHVIHDGDQGMVAKADIRAQVRVLTRAFRKHGLRFKLAGVTYTNNRAWFRKCDKWSKYKKMTKTLAVAPRRNLNIYTCEPAGGVLGFAYMPGSGITGTAQDGVVALYSSLPDGTAAPYNEGDTITHEVGHWAGLYHTFEKGCADPGDRVDDTPPESEPAYGCPVGRDTCAGGGPDPVDNFMDYVDDACMTRFTPGQGARVREQVASFRPEIG